MPTTPETPDRPTAGLAHAEQRGIAPAARAGVDVSVAGRRVAVLRRAGHLRRRPEPDDGRATLLELTSSGAAALAGTRALRSQWAATARPVH